MKMELGKFLKTLIITKGLTQKDFAEKVDLSPTALSQIITGKTKPRQATLTKIMEVLSLTRDEEQNLLKAFESYASLPEDKSSAPDPIRIYQENRERVYRYIDMKARSIAFADEVENIFKGLGVKYRKNYVKNGLVCDFILTDKNIGIECKFNAMRDIEKTLTTLRILQENMGLSSVVLIVPLKSEIPEEVFEIFSKQNIEIISIAEIHELLKI